MGMNQLCFVQIDVDLNQCDIFSSLLCPLPAARYWLGHYVAVANQHELRTLIATMHQVIFPLKLLFHGLISSNVGAPRFSWQLTLLRPLQRNGKLTKPCSSDLTGQALS